MDKQLDLAAEVEWQQLVITRLRDTLRRIQEWDCLNPPDPKSDFPWLKRLVDEALRDSVHES